MIYLILVTCAKSQECSEPVDCSSYCRVTYKGALNYYNKTDGMCYKTINCQENEIYDAEKNDCLTSGSIPNNTYQNNSSEFNQTNVDKKYKCVYGKYVGAVCVCNSGYYTSTYQDPNSDVITLCDTQTDQNSQMTEGTNGEYYLNSQKTNPAMQVPLNPLYKIVILIAFGIISCISSCCYVKKLKKKNNYS